MGSMSKVKDGNELAAIIGDGATIGVCGLGLSGWNEEMARAIERRFFETGHPQNIVLFQSGALGDWTEKRGPTHFGHEGLIKRWIGAHIGSNPNMSRLVEQNKIEAYNLPQGAIIHLWREIAAKRPGLITKVGIKTFVDPRMEGGKLNPLTKTKEDIVKVIELEGEEYLFYKSFPIDFALIRGTVADENGNLTMENEGQLNAALPLAQAAKNSGGIVIAQAEYLASAKSLHPKEVKVPGILVDYIVLATTKENHWQTEGLYYSPAFAGKVKVPATEVPSSKLDERKVISRRAALELERNAIVNLGIGIPTGVATVAAEENSSDYVTLTTEAGGIGGVPEGVPNFGHTYNAEAIIEEVAQFDFYDGGGIDIAFLGMAQADKYGNVNVTHFESKVTGCGGFVDISQNAKKVVFCGTLTAGGLKTKIHDGKLIISEEGKYNKFLEKVEHVSFSGDYARETGKSVLFVTERAVFTLESGEMKLIEIAPGIDLEKDILAHMGFTPVISGKIKEMSPRIFSTGLMGNLF